MPSSDPYDSTGIEYYSIPSFIFSNGTTKPIQLAYQSFNPTARKTALIPVWMYLSSFDALHMFSYEPVSNFLPVMSKYFETPKPEHFLCVPVLSVE